MTQQRLDTCSRSHNSSRFSQVFELPKLLNQLYCLVLKVIDQRFQLRVFRPLHLRPQ